MVSFSRILPIAVALASVEAKLGQSHTKRNLGIRLPNPLRCQGRELKEGTTGAADDGYRRILGIRLVPQGTETSSSGSNGGVFVLTFQSAV